MIPLNLRPFLACALLLACGDGKGTTATTATTATTGDSTAPDGTLDPTTVGMSGDDTTLTWLSTTFPTSTTTGATTTDTGATTSTGTTTTDATSTTDATATTDATTGIVPDGACRSDADCDPNTGESCFAPDESNCGACQIPDAPCDDQQNCDFGLECVPFDVPCACDPGAKQCVPLVMCMTDDQCDLDEVCDNGECVVATCDEFGFACPTFFDCVPDSGGDNCVRHPCAADPDCGDGGFCVEGRCFDTLGSCQTPAP